VRLEKKYQQSAQRQLKVYQKYIPRSHYSHVVFPEIRLCGKWLKDIGFDSGRIINIKQQKNKLTITLDKRQQ
jgi:toxic protein SymE